MTDLQDLYQELILDHNKRPRNFGTIDHPDCHAQGFNPLCGDRVDIFLMLSGGLIRDVRFEGKGCAISTASASIMTDAVKGKTIEQARALFEKFHDLLTLSSDAPIDADGLGKLAAFSGVRQYPARVKCATLAWHTLNAALNNQAQTISTE